MDGSDFRGPRRVQSIAGSFRDPSGHVFLRDGHVFRAVDDACHSTLRELDAAGLLGELVRDNRVVATEFINDPALAEALAAEHPGYRRFLRHERIEPVTYPYEWTVSMLADAGLLTLDVHMRLLEAGFSLKDATAYNVQFVRGRPVFIDVASIERPARLDMWFALGQFHRMFLYPLLLCRHAGWDLRSYFLASLDGRDVVRMAQSLSWLGLLRPGLLLDVTLPLLLHRWAEGRRQSRLPQSGRRQSGLPQCSSLQAPTAGWAGGKVGVRAAGPGDKPRGNAAAQLFNLRRLRRKIARLAADYKPRGVWSQYTRNCVYDDKAEAAKKSLLEEFLRATQPWRVMDLGCNTGQYSRQAAACGAEVVAADADHDAVELLYRGLREQPAAIAPVVLDLGNPSPALGHMNRERPSFFERVRADCLLVLALLHHLLVAGNLPLAAVRDMLWELTARDLILEFVPREDPMFERLLRFRVDLFGGLTLEACRNVFLERFELLGEKPIADSGRTLLLLRKR